MKELEREYQQLLETQHFESRLLDYSILEKHIVQLSQLSRVSNCGITVYDMCRREHVYTSYNFSEIFGYDLQLVESQGTDYFNSHIHPDDLVQLTNNGLAALRHFFKGEGDIEHTKMISEYRIRNFTNEYIRVIEQYQVLEFDAHGHIWLSLSILDISPNTTPLNRVQSKLLNCKTGTAYTLPEFSVLASEENTNPLSPREKEILQMVKNGLLSKEISEQLTISVHTVNTHRQRILEKLNVANSIEAIQYASRLGLLD